MNNLLIVLACCADDAPHAERLLDWLYQLHGKEQRGHILLAYAHDVHQEMRLKNRICAELAFESVSEFQAGSRMLSAPNLKPIELKTKVEFTNNLLMHTAHHVAGHFRWPWLWVEPDCVPLVPNWIELIADAYQKQPKKYLGRRMKRKAGDNDHVFMSRIGVYPTSAYTEMRGFQGSTPIEWVSSPHVLPRSGNTKLIQATRYDGDIAKVDLAAALLHSDKSGKLIEQLREKGVQATEHQNGEEVEVKVANGESFQIPPRSVDMPMPEDNSRLDPEPPDKRTKAYREWKIRQHQGAANSPK